jgi:hypothetical protein
LALFTLFKISHPNIFVIFVFFTQFFFGTTNLLLFSQKHFDTCGMNTAKLWTCWEGFYMKRIYAPQMDKNHLQGLKNLRKNIFNVLEANLDKNLIFEKTKSHFGHQKLFFWKITFKIPFFQKKHFFFPKK